jgi:DNA-directed RNA polymerase subunit RPC12/RpoP
MSVVEQDRIQYRCDGCGRYSHPAGLDEKPQEGFAEGHVTGCWTATGVRCPDCAPAQT